MQQELTAAQRAALRRLLESIDAEVSPDALRHAAVDASSALGVL
jgi:hypothetical protein